MTTITGRPTGRPRWISPEIQERVCTAVRAGDTYRGAAQYAGISYFTLNGWRKRGYIEQAKRDQGAEPDPNEEVFVQFAHAIDAADAEARLWALAHWRQALNEDWRACRDWLARRYPGEWAARTNVEISGPDGGPIEVAASPREAIVARLNQIAQRVDSQIVDVEPS